MNEERAVYFDRLYERMLNAYDGMVERRNSDDFDPQAMVMEQGWFFWLHRQEDGRDWDGGYCV